MDGILLEKWEPIISSGSYIFFEPKFVRNIYKKHNDYFISFCHGDYNGDCT
jgi:hypothetical protein